MAYLDCFEIRILFPFLSILAVINRVSCHPSFLNKRTLRSQLTNLANLWKLDLKILISIIRCWAPGSVWIIQPCQPGLIARTQVGGGGHSLVRDYAWTGTQVACAFYIERKQKAEIFEPVAQSLDWLPQGWTQWYQKMISKIKGLILLMICGKFMLLTLTSSLSVQ